MQSLQQTASHSTYVDIDYPLHPHTDSSEAVARLVGRILDDIQTQPEPVSDFDVLQALTIATAVRLTVADVNRRPGIEMAVELLDIATDSIPARATVS